VANLDSPPVERAAPADSMPPPGQPEASRRRSTVREPAPSAEPETTVNGPANPATAQPTEITETDDGPEGERPRRTGWWSRRFAGG
jgi:ribonuclease E